MDSITVTHDNIHYIKGIDFDIYTNNITCESVMGDPVGITIRELYNIGNRRYDRIIDPVGITIRELYNIGNRRYDRIIDTRLNFSNFLLECPLCGECECPGHFGHIRLEEN